MAPRSSESLATLRTTRDSTKEFVVHFETSIKSGKLPFNEIDDSSPNAISLVSDAAAIFKAQTTKLFLLILNEPYSPPEITFILKSLCQECIPALVSACQLCPDHMYTNFLERILRSCVGTVFVEFLSFLDEIPTDEQGINNIKKHETLRSTGIIWETCDVMVELGVGGLVVMAVSKMEQKRDLLQDAIEEIEEWEAGRIRGIEIDDLPKPDSALKGMEIDEDFKDYIKERNHPDPKDDVEEPADYYDYLMGQLPRAASESIRPALKKAIKTLNLIRLLFPALIRRRVKRFPNFDARTSVSAFPTPKQIGDMDQLWASCSFFSDLADALAGALYAHDEEEVDHMLWCFAESAKKCIERVQHTWDGGEDEFTKWIGTWLVKLDELQIRKTPRVVNLIESSLVVQPDTSLTVQYSP